MRWKYISHNEPDSSNYDLEPYINSEREHGESNPQTKVCIVDTFEAQVQAKRN